MKKQLLTSADLLKSQPASIDLDTFILAPSARITAERLGIPLHKGGVALDGARAGSSKTGGPGAGEYTLVRPAFTPSSQVPRFGNPTFSAQEPIRGSKAWRELYGGQQDQLRGLVAQRLGPGATPQQIEAGVQAVLARVDSSLVKASNPGSHNGTMGMAGASPLTSPAVCGCPTTTPQVIGTNGTLSHKGGDGSIHLSFPNQTRTYLVKIANGQAKVCEVLE
ncbi:MAG TPA: hypothetical protein VEI97_08545 [bacterium]|nr:hypothetical protein [bacterium]